MRPAFTLADRLRTRLSVAPVPDQGDGQRTNEEDDGNREKLGVELIVADEELDSFQEDETGRRIGDGGAPDFPFPDLPTFAASVPIRCLDVL
jgi:hypothetical protein